jgi:hypothetical protein
LTLGDDVAGDVVAHDDDDADDDDVARTYVGKKRPSFFGKSKL